MSTVIKIKNSIVTGIHRTKVASHEDIALNVEKDDTIQHIDPDCMKVVFPTEVANCLLII